MRILVTGHCGFIGAHFVKHALMADQNVQVVGFNRYSDQRNHWRTRLFRAADREDESCRFRLTQVWGDLRDAAIVSGLCEGIDAVVHFAAKTHVDHSLRDPRPFLENNIIGTHNLLDEAERCGVQKFVQVSTDECYGQILEGSYREDAPLNPRNAYSWSKACADLDGLWRHRTRGFPVIVTRCENNFGPWQHRQKAIPTFVRCALASEPLPVYGDGRHVRCWLHVEEHCRAIWHLLEHGRPGEVYHVAGEQEMTNLELANTILKIIGCYAADNRMIRFIPDAQARPGHDRRYALDCSKLKATGFEIKQNLTERLRETVQWYADNKEWLR